MLWSQSIEGCEGSKKMGDFCPIKGVVSLRTKRGRKSRFASFNRSRRHVWAWRYFI